MIIDIILNVVGILVVLITYIYVILILSAERRVSKKEIYKKLTLAIKNSADVDILNDIVRTQKRTKRLYYGTKKQDYYPNLILLAEILEDLRAGEYIQEEKVDTELIKKIDFLIEEDKKKSPFDNLEEKQKDFFENIVNIIDKNEFTKIQSNINKISNELALKSEESKKAKLNFKIAIISIAITIVVGVYQIYDSNNTKQEFFQKFQQIQLLLDSNTSS